MLILFKLFIILKVVFFCGVVSGILYMEYKVKKDYEDFIKYLLNELEKRDEKL